jgi:hypothetical protein
MAITVADAASEAETQQVRAKMLLGTLGDPDLALRGFSQLVWFSTLKTSARNWSLSWKPTDCRLRLRVRLCDQYRNLSVFVQRYHFPVTNIFGLAVDPRGRQRQAEVINEG